MKRLLLTFALVAVTTLANAQGTIQIANNAGTRFRINGVIPANGELVGGTFNFGVFVGLTADALSTEPVGAICTNSSTGGLISGPNANAFQLPGFEPNTTAYLQIRGWESRFGLDWRAGFCAGMYLATPVKPFVLGPASGPGTVIWSSTDFTKFQTMDSLSSPRPPDLCIPEPSTLALIGLGLAGLLGLRRRKCGWRSVSSHKAGAPDSRPAR